MRSIKNAIVPTCLTIITALLLIMVVPSLIPYQMQPSQILSQTPLENISRPKLASDLLLSLKSDFPDCFSDKNLQYFKFQNVTGCTVDKLNFDRYEIKNHSIIGHALSIPHCLDVRQRIVKHPPRVERVGNVTFLLASESFPLPEEHHYHCAYYVTIQFGDGGYVWSEFIFLDECWSSDPKCERRYTVLLTNPRQGRPVAGLAYDSQEQMLYFLVSK